MSGVRDVLVIAIEHGRLIAGVWSRRGGMSERRVLVDELVPAEVADGPTEAKDAWVVSKTKGLRRRGAPVVLVLPRHRIVQHRVPVIGALALSADELASAARLQLERRVAVDLSGAAISVAVGAGDECIATVLTSGDAEQAISLGRALGVRSLRVTARSLASGLVVDNGLVVDVTPVQAEAAVTRGGVAIASATLGPLDDVAGASAWQSELRRLWVAARSESGGAAEVRVLAGRDAGGVRDAVRSVVGVAPSAAAGEPELEVLGAIGAAVLAGEDVPGSIVVGRSTPAVSPGVRVAGLLAALLLILGGGGYVLAQREIDRLEARAERLREEKLELRQWYNGFRRQDGRIAHAERWIGVPTDWLGLIEEVGAAVPTRQARLAEVGGTVSRSIEFTGRKGDSDVGGWRVRETAGLVIDVSAESRDAAGALRQALLASGRFDVQTRGADGDEGIELSLTLREAGEPVDDGTDARIGGRR